MQTTTAPKDSDESDSSGLNWRQRKKMVALRNEGARRRKELIGAYVAALGGRRVTAIVLQNVEAAVDMAMLAKTARAALAAGRTSINDVVKLENAADRAVRRLNLPTPGAAPTGPTLQDFLASHEGDG
jgi:hypothetical protein